MKEKMEKLIGVKVWAVRGVRKGTLYVDKDGFLKVAASKKAFLKNGLRTSQIARIEIIEPRKKTP